LKDDSIIDFTRVHSHVVISYLLCYSWEWYWITTFACYYLTAFICKCSSCAL